MKETRPAIEGLSTGRKPEWMTEGSVDLFTVSICVHLWTIQVFELMTGRRILIMGVANSAPKAALWFNPLFPDKA